MTNYATGHGAERQAAEYLKHQGFKIIELNWKTKYCEIDIVAQKKAIYFVEVKYRRTNMQGSGLEQITSHKFQRMKFAAETWVTHNGWDGDYQLAVIAIDGTGFTFLDEL